MRSKENASYAELLPYWEIKNGVVILETGVMEVGLELHLPSTTLADSSVLERLHTGLTSLLQNAVPQGERLRLSIETAPLRPDLMSRYAAQLVSEHPSARVLSREKTRFYSAAADAGKLVEHRAYLTCSHTPAGRQKKWRSLSEEEFEARCTKALGTRERLLGHLTAIGINAQPLLDRDLFKLIWRYFNPGGQVIPQYQRPDAHYSKHILSTYPELAPPTLRSHLTGSDLARRWDHLWTSGHYVRTVSMGNLPVGETQGGMLGHLLSVPRRYWLSVDYQHEPHGPALRALMARARRLHAATGDTGGLTDYTDASVRVGYQEVDDALTHLSSSGTHVYKVGLSVTVLAADDGDAKQGVTEVQEAFTKLTGVQPVVETAGLLTQFFALAPCSGQTNERSYLTLQENAADFFPLEGPWQGADRPVSLFCNRWDGLTAINPFTPKTSNWNGLVVGGSGSGKTFLMQILLGDLLRQNADVMIVDRGYGYRHLVDLFCGETIAVEPGGVSINPFELPAGEIKADEAKKGFLMALLRAMLPVDNAVSASLENALLSSAVTQLYQTHPQPRLSGLAKLLAALKTVGTRAATAEERRLGSRLALRLEPWTGDAAFASFIDRPTSIQTDAPILYFETSGIDQHPDLRAVGLLVITELIWQRVMRDPARKKVVVLDEVWSLLKLPQAASFIVELYRRFRRYNAAVYAVTQSLEDFQTDAARGILQNTSHHYLLRLATEDKLVRELLTLPDRAMQIFKSLSSQKGRYSEALSWLRQEDGDTGGVLVLRPSPVEYWAYTTNAADMQLRETTLKQNNGDLLTTLRDLAHTHPHGIAGDDHD